MPGPLLNRIRKDAKKFATASGWEEDIQLSTPNSALSVYLKGWHTKHKIAQDTDGGQVVSTNVHILISIEDLTSLDYPFRNDLNDVIDLRNHFVAVDNSEGTSVRYVITETHPSETFGMIVCILSEYTPATELIEEDVIAEAKQLINQKINFKRDF